MSLTDKYKSGRFTEQVDVLDLLINLLREHEEKLDKLIERLENIGLTGELIEKLIVTMKPTPTVYHFFQDGREEYLIHCNTQQDIEALTKLLTEKKVHTIWAEGLQLRVEVIDK